MDDPMGRTQKHLGSCLWVLFRGTDVGLMQQDRFPHAGLGENEQREPRGSVATMWELETKQCTQSLRIMAQK